MIVAVLTAIVGAQVALPANLVPVAKQEIFLTQTFYELDDGSRAEQHEFRIERIFSVENGRQILTEKKWLAGWIIGDVRLDDPIKPAPLVTKCEINPNGTLKLDSLKDFQVEEFRIDRLRWFLPPSTRMVTPSNWKLEDKGNDAIYLPDIRFMFILKKSERVGDFVRHSIETRPIESTFGDRSLQCEGAMEILVKGNTYQIESGQWITPSAQMIGNSSDRFKLVQTVKNQVPKSNE